MRMRSLLFTPAHMPGRFEKALASAADVVIFDLEDAVAPAQKAEARDNLLPLRDRAEGRRMAVRVNSVDTGWYRFDVQAAVAAGADLVMLPKCCGGPDVLRLDAALEAAETGLGVEFGRTGIIALAGEDPVSLERLDYGGLTPRLAAIALGAEDLSGELGVQPRDAEGRFSPTIAHARILIALAARRAGVAAIDTPFPDIQDPDGHAREAHDAAALGFTGKMCIHPAQIKELNKAFQPGDEAVERALRIVAAFGEHAGAGVLQLGGKMVDKAHLEGARRLLARIDA